MLTSSGQHILSLTSWQLPKEMGTTLGSFFWVVFLWLVATIFDSIQSAHVQVGYAKKCLDQNATAAWPVKDFCATGRG